MARQVRLVEEPGCQRNLSQGPPVALRGDQLPGVTQPALDQVLMGCATHRQPKHLHKMVGAQTGEPGRLLHRHAFSEALVKETNCPLQARVASRALEWWPEAFGDGDELGFFFMGKLGLRKGEALVRSVSLQYFIFV